MIAAVLAGIIADPKLIFGLFAGVLSIYAFIPYIIDTARGRTRPERATWLIWSVLASISFASQLAEGLGASFWFVAVQVTGTVFIFLQSITRGAGAYLSPGNFLVLSIAAVGLVLWYLTDTPAFALGISISISLMAGSVTVWKAYRDPASETQATWVVSLIASVFALVAVGSLDWFLLAYPLYLVTLYAAIVVAIFLGRLAGNHYVDDFVWYSRRVKRRAMPPKLSPPPYVRPRHLQRVAA